MKTKSFSRADLENYANNDLAFYGLDISRISSVLIGQCMRFHHNRLENTFEILHEVKYLEGIKQTSATRKEEVFKCQPLQGLWKKHYTSARHILQNIGAHFGYEKGGNKNLDALIYKAFRENMDNGMQALINQITHEGTIEAMNVRASNKAMTGEWIVYQKFEGKNYYLTLGVHGGDSAIYNHVKLAREFDFPFLPNIGKEKTNS